MIFSMKLKAEKGISKDFSFFTESNRQMRGALNIFLNTSRSCRLKPMGK